MPRKPTSPDPPLFEPGTKVRVKLGVRDPNFPDVPLGGWAGTIKEVERADAETTYLIAWDPATRTAHARVFAPEQGVPEDPATGSAALGLGVWLVASGLLRGDGTAGYTVRQGTEIHRPSTLDCTVTAAGGTATEATVTGHVVPIAAGEISVPPFVG